MENVFLTVLNMSITAAYVTAFVCLLRLALKTFPRWISYSLWGVVFFRLLCPVSFSSAFSLLGRLGAPSTQNGAIAYIPHEIGMMQIPNVNFGIHSASQAVNSSLPQAVEASSANPLQVWIFAGTCLWLVGVGAMLLYSLLSYVRLKRRVAEATLLFDNVYETEVAASPFVCGFGRPRIYLPLGLPEQARKYVLRHEQIHIARRDHWVKPLAFFALCIHWFNPLAWLAFRLLCVDMETSCDQQATRTFTKAQRADYGEALLRLAMKKPILSGSPLAFGESGAKTRVKNVLRYQKPAFWVIVIAVVACAVVGISLLANPQPQVTPQQAGEVAMEEVSYSFSWYGEDGELIAGISMLSGLEKQLAQDIIMNALVKSAAWPGVPPQNMPEYFLIRQTFPKSGEMHDYYAYLVDGAAVLQAGENGYYSRIDDTLYSQLAQWMADFKESAASVGGVDGPVSVSVTAQDATDLESCVSQAILKANRGRFPMGELQAQAHTILGVRQEGAYTRVYAVALYQEYAFDDSGFSLVGGCHLPIAVSFRQENGEYHLEEYWEPEDGGMYLNSILEQFPAEYQQEAADLEKFTVPHMQACYRQAIDYGGVDTAPIIAALIEEITASPAAYSNPGAYINAHPMQYQQLLYYGEDTLAYCFAQFEAGGQTGLPGHIMRLACQDIMGGEGSNIAAGNGQQWYDVFQKAAEELSQQGGKTEAGIYPG